MRRLWTVAGLLAVLAVTVPAHASATSAPSPTSTHATAQLLLQDAVEALPVADEVRDGYNRDYFRHWIDADRDGCSTRAEVLLEEATTPPDTSGRCTLAGGAWYSYYDDATVEVAGSLDIDHMVPLAEAWDSGAYEWTAQRRQDYANDLDEPRALVAVTARTNRSKADQDPATWMPPFQPARCTYVTDWITVKTRWALAVDPTEQAVLRDQAAFCPNVPITTTRAGD